MKDRQTLYTSPKKDLEHQEQVELFKWVRLNERRHPELRWVFAIPNGGHRHIKVARRLRAEGVRAGVADIFCPIPRGGYHGLWIEMKVKPNKLTANQKEFVEEMYRQGYKVAVCYSWLEAVRTLCGYLDIRSEQC